MSKRQMKANNLAKIDLIEGATSTFLKELERSLSRLNGKMAVWSSELKDGVRVGTNQRNLARAVNSAAQIEEMFLESGYRDSVTKLMKSYDRITDLSMKGFKYAGIDAALSRTDAAAVLAIRDFDLKRWERQGGDLAATIQEGLIDSVVSGSTFKDMSDRIEKILLGDDERSSAFRGRAETIANTTLQGFDRTMNARIAEKAGVDTFIYLGPEDKITRDFCLAVLAGDGSRVFNIPASDDGVYTLEQINEMDNGQSIGGALVYGGGWNCRHSFSAISPKIVEELQEVA